MREGLMSEAVRRERILALVTSEMFASISEREHNLHLTWGEVVDAVARRVADQLCGSSVASAGSVHHGLDTDEQVLFYEQEFYPLSNFSSFVLGWRGLLFSTSEAAYHWMKFADSPEIQEAIRVAPSAHEAFQLARRHADRVRPDWDQVKVDVMREILREKVRQHAYVRQKLLQTGDRLLVENSWRDPYWGWGERREGQNMLGRLWMEVRAELRAGEEIDE